MNVLRALLAGAVGGITMSVLMIPARFLGVSTSFEMLWGTAMVGRGVFAWVLGLVVHVLASSLIALAYVWGFETMTKRADAASGAALSVVHALIGGTALGTLLPAVHRLIPEQIAGPGYFYANDGVAGVATFAIVHLAYGAIVGTLYSNQARRPRLTAV